MSDLRDPRGYLLGLEGPGVALTRTTAVWLDRHVDLRSLILSARSDSLEVASNLSALRFVVETARISAALPHSGSTVAPVVDEPGRSGGLNAATDA